MYENAIRGLNGPDRQDVSTSSRLITDGGREHVVEDISPRWPDADAAVRLRNVGDENPKKLPYVCDVCGKSFGTWQAKNGHQVNHTDETGLVTDGGDATTASVTVDEFEFDPVQLKVHPDYTGSCRSPSWHVADYAVKVTVDIEPIDESEDTEADWVTLAYPAEKIVGLLSGGPIVEERERLNARYTVTAVVDR